MGKCEFDGKEYFLSEYFPGSDLKVCDRMRLTLALNALIAMQDEYWQREEFYDVCATMEYALNEMPNRGKWLSSELLERAYDEYLRVYAVTPRSLCHDDLLPLNVLANDERAVLIDWEHGGVLPYLNSFARLIAHARNDRSYYFYMSDADKAFAIEYYYNGLVKKHGISYDEFRRTLDVFLFFEYCEWVMLGNRYDARDDERYGYYLALAEDMAKKILA